MQSFNLLLRFVSFFTMNLYQDNATMFYDGYWFATSDTSLVVYFLISTITIVGNSIICILFLLDPIRELRSLQNYFIVNLAVSDLIMGAIVEPLLIATHWKTGKTNFLFFIHYQFAIIAGASSVSNVAALSVCRYYAVKMPLSYQRVLTRKRLLYSIAFIWFFAVHFALLTLFWRTLSYQIYVYSIGCLLPSFAIMLIYYRVFKAIRTYTARFKNSNERQNLSSSTYAMKNAVRREKATNKTILIILIVFLVHWTPFVVVDILMVQFHFRSKWFHTIRDVVLTMAYSSSGINPFLYAWRIPQFRQAFSKMCGCQKLHERAEADRNRGPIFQERNVVLGNRPVLCGIPMVPHAVLCGVPVVVHPSNLPSSESVLTSAATLPVGISEIDIKTL